VEVTAAGTLFGHGCLDHRQYATLGYVTSLLRQVQRAMGGTRSIAGVWSAIAGAVIKTTPGVPPITGDNNARHILERICSRLDGSKNLVLELAAEDGRVPDIVLRAADHRLTPRDLVQLELLRHGLDGISVPRWVQAD
jgi:hypothetical protein